MKFPGPTVKIMALYPPSGTTSHIKGGYQPLEG
jgi:hypothetical protein